MNCPPELDLQVSLTDIAAFAGDGQIYRAYAHALAVAKGMVLLVPIELVSGDLTDLVDAIPVSWEEIIAILETPDQSPRPLEEHIRDILGRPLRAIAPTHWDVDHLDNGMAFRAEITRLSHPSGIRLAVLSSLIPHGWH
jgi:hypothetical protein